MFTPDFDPDAVDLRCAVINFVGDRGREGVLATTVVVVYSLFNRHSSPFDLEVAESTVHDDEGFVRTHQPVDCPSFYICLRCHGARQNEPVSFYTKNETMRYFV